MKILYFVLYQIAHSNLKSNLTIIYWVLTIYQILSSTWSPIREWNFCSQIDSILKHFCSSNSLRYLEPLFLFWGEINQMSISISGNEFSGNLSCLKGVRKGISSTISWFQVFRKSSKLLFETYLLLDYVECWLIRLVTWSLSATDLIG